MLGEERRPGDALLIGLPAQVGRVLNGDDVIVFALSGWKLPGSGTSSYFESAGDVMSADCLRESEETVRSGNLLLGFGFGKRVLEDATRGNERGDFVLCAA